ncbi:MAG: hypothetical protein IJV28_04065 [Paludibacteraceae bacterium]|nr:hypothetical protein [Paludibacteraceae bacterium]
MKRIYLILSLFFMPFSLMAEHLFEAGVHGGIAGWNAQSHYVSPRVGFHGGAQIYYTYLSPRVIGLRTGVTFDSHHPGFGKLNYEDHYSTIDVENQQMDIDYTIGNLYEKYSIWSVGVPVQLAFTKKRFTFYAGAKAVFPLSSQWKQTVDKAALSVYYPYYDNRIYESYPLSASRDFKQENEGKMTLPKVQWWLALELNYTIPLNTWATRFRSYIMVGAYFDYCFSRYTPSRSMAESLIMLTDTRDGFPLQRVLTPVLEANRQGRKLVTACSLYDVGIKISYAISPYDAHSAAKKSCNCLR